MPAGSGDLCTVSFTPPIDGLVFILSTFRISGTGIGGGNAWAQLFLEQNGVRVWGGIEVLVPGYSEVKSSGFALQARFAVIAGAPVVCGLYGRVNSGASASWSDIDVTPALHKRGA